MIKNTFSSVSCFFFATRVTLAVISFIALVRITSDLSTKTTLRSELALT